MTESGWCLGSVAPVGDERAEVPARQRGAIVEPDTQVGDGENARSLVVSQAQTLDGRNPWRIEDD